MVSGVIGVLERRNGYGYVSLEVYELRQNRDKRHQTRRRDLQKRSPRLGNGMSSQPAVYRLKCSFGTTLRKRTVKGALYSKRLTR